MIANDNSADLGSTTGTSLTTAYANAGDILFVHAIGQSGASTSITGITFNGVSLTQIGTGVNAPSGNWNHLYYLINPAQGTHNIVISGSPSAFIEGLAASYTGATGGIDASTTNTGTGITSLATSVTTIQANDWFIATAQATQNVSAGSNTTRRIVSATFGGIAIFDSNAALSAGSNTSNISLSVSGSIGTIMAAFVPTQAGGYFLYNYIR